MESKWRIQAWESSAFIDGARLFAHVLGYPGAYISDVRVSPTEHLTYFWDGLNTSLASPLFLGLPQHGAHFPYGLVVEPDS